MSRANAGHDELLLAVFRFKNQAPSSTQTESFCLRLRDALGKSVEKCLQNDGDNGQGQVPTAGHLDSMCDDLKIPLDRFAPHDYAWLRRGWPQLHSAPSDAPAVGAVWTVEWFPAYAGVLQAEQVGVETIALRVVALDNWELARHFLPSGECVHGAVSTKHVVLMCGLLEKASLPEFRTNLQHVLSNAKLITGTARSAFSHSGSAGHQKTPQFLVAAVRTAEDQVSETTDEVTHKPRGGMTDVGRHTGGEARDTCWPLVCAAVRQSLPPSGVVADKILLKFSASLLEGELEHLSQCTGVGEFWSQVDKCMEMLDSIGVAIVQLVDEGYDGTGWLAQCQRWRQTLDNEAMTWNQASAGRFRLPDLQHDVSHLYPTLAPPHQQLFDTKINGAATWSIERCSVMTQQFMFLNAESCSPQQLLEFLDSMTAQEEAKVIFGLRAVEKALMVSASTLTGDRFDGGWDAGVPEQLLELISWYRDHQPTSFHSDESKRLGQQSMLTVLSWAVFCLAHRFCVVEFEELKKYRIALDWHRLDVCVLRERSARQALRSIAKYIRDWNQRVLGPSVFDLSNHSGTMAFARQLGTLYEDSFTKVQMQWQVTCDSTWAKISARKVELKAARHELATYEEELCETKKKLADEEAKLLQAWEAAEAHRRPKLKNWLTGQYKSEINQLNNNIYWTTTKCNSLRRMPEILVSPLPFEKATALQLLCLIAPPLNIDILAEICWRAQRSLSPVGNVPISSPGNTTWRAHFEEYSGGVALPNPARFGIAYPGRLAVPTSFGPNSIDDVCSKEAFIGSSSWFPDFADSSVHWRDSSAGSSDRWTNPFLIDAATSRKGFTPCVGNGWQWAVEYPVMEALVRGNATYARWGECPNTDDSREGPLEFSNRGELRAYPTQQLRRVFASVEADVLTWSSPTVVQLIQHAVYQVGQVDGTHTPPRFVWHEDLDDEASVEHFCAALGRLVEELDHSPRRWACLPLVSALVGFLCQYSFTVKPLLLKLSRMAQRWAEDAARLRHREGIDDTERNQLRTRECVLLGYAALCYDHYGVRTLQNEDVEEICALVVQFYHAKLFVVSTDTAVVSAIRSRVHRMMADRIRDVVTCLQESLTRGLLTRLRHLVSSPETGGFLTRLCRLVNSTIPDDLSWRSVETSAENSFSSCFIATSEASEAQYLINIFTGAIKTNGSRPSNLPASIRQMPLYRRLFDDQDFEVTRRADVYTTTRQYRKSLTYHFHVGEHSGELLIEEHGPSFALQLCAQEWRRRFAAVFPRRLSELYTQWWWIDRRVVFLRRPEMSDTGVHFVIKFDDNNGSAFCFEVPRQDWGVAYDQLVARSDDYPVFVVPDNALCKTLGKFEAPEFVHVMQRDCALEISLPRFGLQFKQDCHGCFESVNHRGFVLHQDQQLDSGQMPRFRQYLVLVSGDSRRLLIPSGHVYPTSSTGLVQIVLSSDASDVIGYFAIDEHPRLKVFAPNTVDAQLQLTAIFAASDSLLPWKDLGMTGGEAALRLLRGCCPSRPFSGSAMEHLVSIATCFAYRAPVLTMFVALLFEKSRRLEFLFDSEELSATVSIADALDEYRQKQSTSCAARVYPYRQTLSREEEWDLFGSSGASETTHARTYVRPRKVVRRDEEPSIDPSFLRSVEAELKSFVRVTHPSDDEPVPMFPLSLTTSNTMGEQMMNELQESWENFHRHSTTATLTLSTDEFFKRAHSLLASVRSMRARCDADLKSVVTRARCSVSDQVLETIGRLAQLDMGDVMRSVLDETVILHLAPHLPPSARPQWKQKCLNLLEVCVLEDKLERIMGATSDSQMLEELQTVCRPWKPEEYPYWLVFEAEGRLQIRHEQYVIAKHLIDNPGSICQLNMGRGKTRVILPMLFLYYSYQARQHSCVPHIVRAHFLSTLLSETRDFMWRVLTAGVLRLVFIEVPFNRSVGLGRREFRRLQHALNQATRNGAIVMVAPEHRLSLELKRVETQSVLDKPEALVFDDVLDPSRYINVFDESDALLHHGYHLVYAVGASIALDGGADRWLTAEALLRVLVSDKSDRLQLILLRFPGLASVRPEYHERRGGTSGGGIFNGFQLSMNTSSDNCGGSDDARAAFRLALVEDLMDHAPFDLEWLRVFGTDREMRAALLRLLTNVTIDADEAMSAMPPAILNVKQQVLALRGLLSFGVFENCLQKRYRVNYGHPRPGSRPKAMAIPYQAADLPSERSEFSHPDVGIVLTLLSFYHSGLSANQVRRAFEILLSLDTSESCRYYSEWFRSIARSISSLEERQMLENLAHISLDNAHQFDVVFATCRYAIEVVNFYVNFCVFPNDTRQFPSRLSRSAWDLVRGPHNVGFSGTNDTHALLPVAVTQREPDAPLLRGTNGKMMQLLLDATRGYSILPTGDEGGHGKRACWQSLLLCAVEKRCDALIDTGALLAGVSSHDAALFLVTLPGFAHQGVTYYDSRPEFDGWVVYVKARDLVYPHKTSSLREHDTFVLFDEARSRGSDMKLLPQAVALQTLGPTITKDKLMQGAGRLRQLGKHRQTLELTSMPDVYASIVGLKRGAGAVTVVDVLNWVVENTQRQCTFGLLDWAQSGLQYHMKEADEAHELQADDWTLDGQYAGARFATLIRDVVETKVTTKAAMLQPGGGDTTLLTSEFDQIRTHGQRFGSHDVVCVTSLGDECERELQIEEEQQEERECVRHAVDPCAESVWDWRLLLQATSVRDLGIGGALDVVDAATKRLHPRECLDMGWTDTKLFGTANFWSTVKARDARLSVPRTFPWTSCLRHIHAIIAFADGTTLMLSEMEADAVLHMLHDERLKSQTGIAAGSFVFVQLPFVVGFLRRIESTEATSSTCWRRPHRWRSAGIVVLR